MSDLESLPRALAPVRAAIPDALAEGAVLGLGEHALATRALYESGFVAPDVLIGMTLFLLTGQPRPEREPGSASKGAVAGGVWVREQAVLHHPLRRGEALEVTGRSERRFVLRGRHYGVTTSETRGADGAHLVSSRTTGLLRFRKDETAVDTPGAEFDPPAPADPSHAARNPALDALRAVKAGERIEGAPARITLAQMRARSGQRDDNPIHTDPEVARREGLAAPIAGGSHVLSFVFEALQRAWGPQALLYGSSLDVRWRGQTYADAEIRPWAEVLAVGEDEIEVALQVDGADRVALEGRLWIPLPRSGS